MIKRIVTENVISWESAGQKTVVKFDSIEEAKKAYNWVMSLSKYKVNLENDRLILNTYDLVKYALQNIVNVNI